MTEPVGVSILWEDAHFQQGVLFYLNAMTKMKEESLKTSQSISKSTQQITFSTQRMAQQSSKHMKKWGDGMTSMTRMAQNLVPALGLLGAARAVQRFVSDSLKEFKKFEAGMAEVFTLMPQLSEGARLQMTSDIMALSREQGRLTDETVPALYQAISAGVPPENVMTFMETASIAARGGVTDLKTSVDVLTTIVNAYGSAAISAERASDILFAAVQGGKVTFTEMAKTAFNVVPIAASLGVKFEDVAAAIAAMTKQGVPARTATTQLRQVLVNISQEGREAATVFERVAGVSFAKFIAQGNNLYDAMQIIEQAAQDANVTTADLFGNIRAGQGALVLTGAGANLFAYEMNRAAESAGAMTEASETMKDTFQFTLDQAVATTEALKIMIGEGLEPFFAAVIGGYQLFISGLITLGSGGQRAKAASQSLQESIDKMIVIEQMGRLKALVNQTKDFNALQIAALRVTGSYRGVADSMDNLTVAIASSSRTYNEAIDKLKQVYGETLQWHEASGKFIIKLDGLNRSLSFTKEELLAVIDSGKAYTEEMRRQEEATLAAKAAEEERLSILAQEAERAGELKQAAAEYTIGILGVTDSQKEWTDQLVNFAVEAGWSIESTLELAKATGEYSDAEIEATKILGLMMQNVKDLMSTQDRHGMTMEEIIEQTETLYGERLANAQATIDETKAEEDLMLLW